MKMVLWFDTETTGLDPVKNDIIQLAGVIDVDGIIRESFDLRIAPNSIENISPEAIETHGVSIEEMMSYPSAIEQKNRFASILGKYCNKYDRSQKYYIGGYNVRFDVNFLSEFFKKCSDNYLGSWINWKMIDPLPFLHVMDFRGDLSLPNYKLETACNHFGVQIENAHDAISDILATRELSLKVIPNI